MEILRMNWVGEMWNVILPEKVVCERMRMLRFLIHYLFFRLMWDAFWKWHNIKSFSAHTHSSFVLKRSEKVFFGLPFLLPLSPPTPTRCLLMLCHHTKGLWVKKLFTSPLSLWSLEWSSIWIQLKANQVTLGEGEAALDDEHISGFHTEKKVRRIFLWAVLLLINFGRILHVEKV